MNQREQILNTVKAVPQLPTGTVKVMHLLQQPDVEVSELIKVIEYDPGLTSNVLRLSNSAYFGGSRTISSLRDAIVRLGTNRIFQLVLTTAVSPLARRPVKGYDMPPGDLLNHSVATAVTAERLADVLNLGIQPHLFTAALLHDLGKIVLGTFAQVDVESVKELAFRERMSFEKAEREVLGIDHPEVGACLLETWELPRGIVDTVRWHHEPEQLDDPSHVVDLVHVANNLCLELGIGGGIDGLNYKPSESVAERLGLRVKILESVACDTLASMAELRQLLLVDDTER